MAYIKNYYVPSACDKLITSINSATGSIKYLLNCPQSHKDNKYITPELLEAYDNLASACKELVSVHAYYSKSQFYLAADDKELAAVASNAIAALLLEQGKNPVEALAAVQDLINQEGK